MYLRPQRHPCEWIRIHLERVALCEYHVTTHGGSTAAIRTLQTALDYLILTKEALESIVTEYNCRNPIELETTGEMEEGHSEFKTETLFGINLEELNMLIPILESRLASVLKEMVKVNVAQKNKGKSLKDGGGLDAAKRMYSVVLRSFAAYGSKELCERYQGIAETLKNLADIKKELQCL